MTERHLQIIIQGYTSEGLSDKAFITQNTFPDLNQAKEKARILWKEFQTSTNLPFLQLFISDIDLQKNIFYSSNFK